MPRRPSRPSPKLRPYRPKGELYQGVLEPAYLEYNLHTAIAMRRVAEVFLCLGILACSREGPVYTLRLKFPASLEVGSRRFENFVTRASHLVLAVEGAEVQTLTIPVADWDRIQIPIKQQIGRVEVRVQLWDRTVQGSLRAFPALAGRKKFSEADFGSRDGLLMRLYLGVSPSEYD